MSFTGIDSPIYPFNSNFMNSSPNYLHNFNTFHQTFKKEYFSFYINNRLPLDHKLINFHLDAFSPISKINQVFINLANNAHFYNTEKSHDIYRGQLNYSIPFIGARYIGYSGSLLFDTDRKKYIRNTYASFNGNTYGKFTVLGSFFPTKHINFNIRTKVPKLFRLGKPPTLAQIDENALKRTDLRPIEIMMKPLLELELKLMQNNINMGIFTNLRQKKYISWLTGGLLFEFRPYDPFSFYLKGEVFLAFSKHFEDRKRMLYWRIRWNFKFWKSYNKWKLFAFIEYSIR